RRLLFEDSSLKNINLCKNPQNLASLGVYRKGLGDQVARSRPWGRRAPGSKPDSTEDPPCMGPVAR
ncbi:hypothetical protein AVEN_129640-1, partial [Araneus ventricosus]